MDYALESTIDIKFTTRAFATGLPTTLAGTPEVVIYEDNSTNEITGAETLMVDFDAITGLNNLRIALNSANGFEAGKNYSAVLIAGTVGGTSVVGEVIGNFSVQRSAAYGVVADGTHGNSALKAMIEAVDTVVDTIKVVTDNLPDNGAMNALASILTDTGTTLPNQISGLNNLSATDVNAELDTALADYDAPTKAEMDAALAALNDPSTSDIAAAIGFDPGTLVNAIWAAASRTLTANTNLNDPSAAAIVSAMQAVADEFKADVSSLATAAALASVAANIAAILADTGTDGVAISTITAQAIADEILARSADQVEDDAGVLSLAGVILATFESAIDGDTWAIKKSDGTSPFATRTLTTDGDAQPITGVS